MHALEDDPRRSAQTVYAQQSLRVSAYYGVAGNLRRLRIAAPPAMSLLWIWSCRRHLCWNSLVSERLERDLGAIVGADLGDRFGELRPDLVAAHCNRQFYSYLAAHRYDLAVAMPI